MQKRNLLGPSWDVFCTGAVSMNRGRMLACAALLCLLAVTGRVVASESKAVLYLKPQWSTIFEGTTVTLVCNASSSSANLWYTWYKDSKKLTTEKGKNMYYFRKPQTSDSGAYSCETPNSGQSDPVKLTVSNDWVILQGPYSAVFEGETVTIGCLGWKNNTSNIRLYKDEQLMARDQQYFSISNVNVIGHSGKYTCKIQRTFLYDDESDALHISVRELFPPPVLEIKPSASPAEGSSVSLMCKTELAAQRRHTKLLFTFYKDQQVLVQKSDSPEYTIEEAQLENSGKYFCKVQTENLRIEKSSASLQIHVQQLFTVPQLEIKPSTAPVEGSSVFLTCKTELMVQEPNPKLHFSFYKDLWTSLIKTDSPDYIIRTAQLADSGAYHCQVETVRASVRKSSPQSHIHVQRVPVSGISIEVQPPGGLVNEGANLLVTCSVTAGTGLVTISLCTLDPYSCENRSALSLKSKQFSKTVSEKDNGKSLFCMASNDKQMTPIKTGSLQISVRLRVSQPVLHFGHCALVGDTVVMVCESLRGSPPICYQFYHGQRILGSLEVNETGPGNLSVTVASEADSGVYSCDAKNDVTSSVQRSKTVMLSVIVPVSGATLSFNKESPEIWTGDNLTLTCAVATGTSPAFHWLHNGKEVDQTSEHYSINAEGKSLHIGSVQPLHRGSYQCSVTNQLNAERTFNVSSNTLTLTVLGSRSLHETLSSSFPTESQNSDSQAAAASSSSLSPDSSTRVSSSSDSTRPSSLPPPAVWFFLACTVVCPSQSSSLFTIN